MICTEDENERKMPPKKQPFGNALGPKFKKQRLTRAPKPTHWSCVQTLLGPRCIDADSPDLSRGEFKLERYDSEDKCKATECFRNPQSYDFENKDVLGVLSSFLDSETLGTLTDLDPTSRHLLDDDFNIARLSELLVDGFFNSLGISRDQEMTLLNRFWANFRRTILRPRDYIEQEAAQSALEIIMDTMRLNPSPIGSNSALLGKIHSDSEFIQFVNALYPELAKDFTWFLSGGTVDGIVDLQGELDFTQAAEWWSGSMRDLVDLVQEATERSSILTPGLVTFIGQELKKLNPWQGMSTMAHAIINLASVVTLISTIPSVPKSRRDALVSAMADVMSDPKLRFQTPVDEAEEVFMTMDRLDGTESSEFDRLLAGMMLSINTDRNINVIDSMVERAPQTANLPLTRAAIDTHVLRRNSGG